jgi:hypothetical protein
MKEKDVLKLQAYMEDKLGIKNPDKEIAELSKQRRQLIVKERIEEMKRIEDQGQMVKSFDVFSNAITESGKNSPHSGFIRKISTETFSKSIAILPAPTVSIKVKEVPAESQDEPNKLQLNYQQITLKPIGSRHRGE